MTETINPAIRLHRVISQLSRECRTQKVEDVIKHIYAVENDDIGLVYNNLVSLLNLSNEVMSLIDETEGIYEKERYIESLINVHNYIKNCLRGTHDTKGPLDEGTIQGVLNCANILQIRQIKLEDRVEDNDLNNIRNEANEFSEYIIDSKIDKILKEVLLKSTEFIRRATIEYSLHGLEGLLHAINLGVAELFRLKDILSRNEANKEAGHKFWDLLVKWDKVLARYGYYAGYAQLVPATIELITD